MNTLKDIEDKVNKLAKLISAPKDLLPTFGTSERDGTPHIEINGENYYYMAYDRSVTTINRNTQDIQELLYWIFQDITFSMGFSYERKNRNLNVEFRREAFRHQLELLDKLDHQWKKFREKEIEEILSVNPYRD